MSRRDQITMTDGEVRDFLVASRTMILVSNGKDGYPHPMPMWYWIDEAGTIYMTTFRKSQKINNLKRDPKVSLLVESGEVYQELKSVLIYATAEIIDDLENTTNVMFNLSRARGEVKAEQADAIKPALAKTAEKRVVIKMVPERIVSWDHSKLGGTY